LSSCRVKIIRRKCLGSDLCQFFMQPLIRGAKGVVGFCQTIDLRGKELYRALKTVGADALVVNHGFRGAVRA